MVAFENQFGPVAVLVCVVFQLLTWFVSAVQAVQSLSPQSKTGVSGLSPGSNLLIFLSSTLFRIPKRTSSRVAADLANKENVFACASFVCACIFSCTCS